MLGAVVASTTGCWELLPASRDPLEDAQHHEEEACGGATPSYPQGFLSRSSVLGVEPDYLTASEHGNQSLYLVGSTLAVRAFPGVSSEELERLLVCHAARSQLGRAGEPAVANDPFWTPGHAVKISVDFAEGATRIHVRSKDPEGAKLLLEQARAFVREPVPPSP